MNHTTEPTRQSRSIGPAVSLGILVVLSPVFALLARHEAGGWRWFLGGMSVLCGVMAVLRVVTWLLKDLQPPTKRQTDDDAPGTNSD